MHTNRKVPELYCAGALSCWEREYDISSHDRGHYQMDTLDHYRQIIEKTLTDYAAIPYAYGEIQSEVVFDRHHEQGFPKNKLS